MDGEYKAIVISSNHPRITTSPGRHGGCKGEGHCNDLYEREAGMPNWQLNRDVVDEAAL